MTPTQDIRHPSVSGMAPEQIFLTNLATIDAVIQMIARQHRMSKADAEEFASTVRLRLIERNYAIIRKFGGRSSFRTYLTVVIARQGLDYRDACWGRWRPSKAARRLGAPGVALETLVVRDGVPFERAWATLPPVDDEEERARLRAFAGVLSPRVRRRWVPLADIEDTRAGPPAPETEALSNDRHATTALARALRGLQPADYRLLKQRFSHGMSISSIARREGLDQAWLYRRVALLLRRMRRELEGHGIAAVRG